MNELLDKVIGAHGGMDRWRQYSRLTVSLVTGGGLFPLKGILQDSESREQTISLHEQRGSLQPYGWPDWHTSFTIDPWVEGEEGWRVLRASFPDSIASHSQVQEFFFAGDFLLRRHDYHVEVAGGFAAAQLVSDYVESGGLKFPSKRRAYFRGPDVKPVRELLAVSIDLSDFRLR